MYLGFLVLSSCEKPVTVDSDSRIYGVWKSEQERSYESMVEYAEYNDIKKAAFKAGFGKTVMTFTREGKCIIFKPSYEMPIGDGKTFTCKEVNSEVGFNILATSADQVVLKFKVDEDAPRALRDYEFWTIFIEDDDTISVPHNSRVANMSLPGREYFKRQKN